MLEICHVAENYPSRRLPLPQWREGNTSLHDKEYDRRLNGLRRIMARMDLPAVLLTSMHNIAYYSGFLYCSFGRPYACVVTQDTCTTVSANIDAGQPWRRSFGDNITYTDWQRGNYWRAIHDADRRTWPARRRGRPPDARHARPGNGNPRRTGHVRHRQGNHGPAHGEIAEEIRLIKSGAKVADIGGDAIRNAIHVGCARDRYRHGRTRCHGTRHCRASSR